MKKTITILLTLTASITLGLIIYLLFDLNWLLCALIILVILVSHSLFIGISERITGGLIHRDQESDEDKNEFKKAIIAQSLLIILALGSIIVSIFFFDQQM